MEIISTLSEKVQLQVLKTICNKIYVARNISLDQEAILEQLKEIDRLFRENESNN